MFLGHKIPKCVGEDGVWMLGNSPFPGSQAGHGIGQSRLTCRQAKVCGGRSGSPQGLPSLSLGSQGVSGAAPGQVGVTHPLRREGKEL